MHHEQNSAPSQAVDITACLTAVRMYDAAYHRDRGNDTPLVVEHRPRIVSAWTYFWNVTLKTGHSLTGQLLIVTACVVCALVVVNVARNLYDIGRAQPIVHEGQLINLQTHQPYTYRWEVPSSHPLPEGFEKTNLQLYLTLALGIVLCSAGSRLSLKRARKIDVGIPITHTATAQLPPQEILLRASQEPSQAQQTLLLRATIAVKPPEDQLLRVVAGESERADR